MSNPDYVIETCELTCRFGRTEAVHGLNLRVEPGTVCALLGHNGAGKSTTMHLLLDMLRPSSGAARVFGKNARQLTEEDRARIGWVADNHDLPGWMTVKTYLRFLKPMYPGWDTAFCDRLQALFALPMDRKIKHLSRGQRMKTAFLGALSYHPRLLLLDEPFSGLDPAVREDLLDAIMDLTQQEEWTVLLSSHDMDEVERVADQVAMMQEGRLLFHESIESLLNRCRLVRVSCALESLPAGLPENWASRRLRDGELQFIDTAFEETKLNADLASHLPGSPAVEVSRVPLKTLCAALIRPQASNSAVP
jgi:ABC-2 type transport system ATP-binding protein